MLEKPRAAGRALHWVRLTGYKEAPPCSQPYGKEAEFGSSQPSGRVHGLGSPSPYSGANDLRWLRNRGRSLPSSELWNNAHVSKLKMMRTTTGETSQRTHTEDRPQAGPSVLTRTPSGMHCHSLHFTAQKKRRHRETESLLQGHTENKNTKPRHLLLTQTCSLPSTYWGWCEQHWCSGGPTTLLTEGSFHL